MATTLTSQQFVRKWRSGELKEHSGYEEHVFDLCRLVGHATPVDLDRKGEFFTFEAEASKQVGGQGWARVWKKGFFGLEYKGKHADLDKAYQQLLHYPKLLQNLPPPTTNRPVPERVEDPRAGCEPAYPTICVPPPPPDLDCGEISARNFLVNAPVPHAFEGDGDGVGCESYHLRLSHQRSAGCGLPRRPTLNNSKWPN